MVRERTIWSGGGWRVKELLNVKDDGIAVECRSRFISGSDPGFFEVFELGKGKADFEEFFQR